MLVFLLALAALLYLGSTYFKARKTDDAPGAAKVLKTDEAPGAPKARLDNMRDRARAIEADDERRNRETLEKTEGK